MNPEEMVKQYRQRSSALDTEYNNLLSIHRDIRDFLAPRSARFDGERVHNGMREDLNIINTNPRLAVRTLPSGMQAGITSPMRPWFRLGTAVPDLNNFQPVKEWLHNVERIMREVFARSNIYDRIKSNYFILGNYGTSALFIDEDEEDVIRGHDLLMGSFRVTTNSSGKVDVLYRHVTMTTMQLMEKAKAGWKVPQVVKSAYDSSNYERRFKVCHIIEPNRNYKPGSALTQYKKYASLYLLEEVGPSEAIMSIKGYDELPMMCPRWDVIGEDAYGVGCGEIALGDSKGLQLLEKRSYQAIDKNVNPPMVADASLRNQRVSILPGDTTFVNGLAGGAAGYRPAYQVNPYTDKLEEKARMIERRIDEAYFKNLFLMVANIAEDHSGITATQVQAMREEKLMMLGPVMERINDELLDPMISRVFQICWRAGMFPPPPKELAQQPLKVEYISVLSQAQKAISLANIERFTNFTIGLAADTQDMRPLDKMSFDEIIDEYADGLAIPPKIVVPTDKADEIRVQRQEAQEAQQAAAAMPEAVKSVKALSETNMQGDNALTRALGL